jgi:hypothetical protein
MNSLRRLLATWFWQPLNDSSYSVKRVTHGCFRYLDKRIGKSFDFCSEPGQGEALVDLKDLDQWTQPALQALTKQEHDEALRRIAAFFEMNGFKLVTIRTFETGRPSGVEGS